LTRERESFSGNATARIALPAMARNKARPTPCLLFDKNEEKTSTEAYRTLTNVQNSGGDLQVIDKVGVPDGI
jgi:hypothetical protein